MDIRTYFSTVQDLLSKTPFEQVDKVVDAMVTAYRAERSFTFAATAAARRRRLTSVVTLPSARLSPDNRATV